MTDISVIGSTDVQAANDKKGVFARAFSFVNYKTAKALFKWVGMPLLLWMAARGFAQAEDLVAPGRQDAEDSFGEKSSTMYYIMLAEVILVLLAYAKTHNPALFLLIPVFIVATKVIFTMIESRYGSGA